MYCTCMAINQGSISQLLSCQWSSQSKDVAIVRKINEHGDIVYYIYTEMQYIVIGHASNLLFYRIVPYNGTPVIGLWMIQGPPQG